MNTPRNIPEDYSNTEINRMIDEGTPEPRADIADLLKEPITNHEKLAELTAALRDAKSPELALSPDVKLITVATALAGYGLRLAATQDGWLRIERWPITREQALAFGRHNRSDSMFFTPSDGLCGSCGGDLVEQYGLHSIAAGLNVTGCRRCNRSYCD